MDRQNALLDQWRASALQLEEQVARVLIGQPKAIRLVNIAVFARGHVLLQGDVGVGKTTLLRAFARALGGGFARVEGTIDLMPNDLIYYTYVSRDGRPAVDPGPLLQHGEDLSIFFLNEINRARPQVHSPFAARHGGTYGQRVQQRTPLSAPAGVRRPQSSGA
jgi:MoxR-like ATPase